MVSSVAVRHIDTLGTVVVLLLYVCMWSSARDAADTWLEAIDPYEKITAQIIAHKVVRMLFVTWIWILLLVVLLFMIQLYLLHNMRATQDTSKYGTAFTISFSILVHKRILVAFLASIAFTYIFAWIVARRALVGAKSHERVMQAVRDTVSYTMKFNLTVVVISILLSSSIEQVAKPVSSSQT